MPAGCMAPIWQRNRAGEDERRTRQQRARAWRAEWGARWELACWPGRGCMQPGRRSGQSGAATPFAWASGSTSVDPVLRTRQHATHKMHRSAMAPAASTVEALRHGNRCRECDQSNVISAAARGGPLTHHHLLLRRHARHSTTCEVGGIRVRSGLKRSAAWQRPGTRVPWQDCTYHAWHSFALGCSGEAHGHPEGCHGRHRPEGVGAAPG